MVNNSLPETDSNSQADFTTAYLPLAAWLVASKNLAYRESRLVNGGGRVAFVFEDTNGLSGRLRMEFDGGALIPANGFYAALSFLHREIKQVKGQR